LKGGSQIILTPDLARDYVRTTLANLVREFPCKLDHVICGPQDLRSPRELHPLFYGSFDWHSCVHGYWQLVRLRRLFPAADFAEQITRHLDEHFTASAVAAEVEYIQRPTSHAFERPYGWAWLLELIAELQRCPDPPAARWREVLAPLGRLIGQKFLEYLGKSEYPARQGTHGNSAFAISLAHDYATACGDARLQSRLEETARRWFGADRDAPAWEPSSEDFLSPTLVTAECMARLLPREEFWSWFRSFLPHVAEGMPETLFRPVRVLDRADLKFVHLDGLNLSRAWCWRRILRVLDDQRLLQQVLPIIEAHLSASLPAIEVDYSGSHWLATFAVLALTDDVPAQTGRAKWDSHRWA
jgi:hypothetical protein